MDFLHGDGEWWWANQNMNEERDFSLQAGFVKQHGQGLD